MKTFILILVLSTGYKGSVSVTEFDSMEKCVAAGEAVLASEIVPSNVFGNAVEYECKEI